MHKRCMGWKPAWRKFKSINLGNKKAVYLCFRLLSTTALSTWRTKKNASKYWLNLIPFWLIQISNIISHSLSTLQFLPTFIKFKPPFRFFNIISWLIFIERTQTDIPKNISVLPLQWFKDCARWIEEIYKKITHSYIIVNNAVNPMTGIKNKWSHIILLPTERKMGGGGGGNVPHQYLFVFVCCWINMCVYWYILWYNSDKFHVSGYTILVYVIRKYAL